MGWYYYDSMHYIVGLGNPGIKYERTRHNVGWMVLDTLREQMGMGEPVMSSKCAGRIVEAMWEGEEVTLLYPETFMNNSGAAVKRLVPRNEVERLIVVYDDIDLAFGELKVSVGRGDGGHNGVKSIIKEVGSKEFVRVRVGIAPTSFWTGKPRRPEGGAAMTQHVLGEFRAKEERQLDEILKRAVGALATIIKSSPEAAMNEWN